MPGQWVTGQRSQCRGRHQLTGMLFSGAHHAMLPFGLLQRSILGILGTGCARVGNPEFCSSRPSTEEGSGAVALSVHLGGETLQVVHQTASLHSGAC